MSLVLEIVVVVEIDVAVVGVELEWRRRQCRLQEPAKVTQEMD